MNKLLNYTQNNDKTEHQLYVSGFNCIPQNAYEIMMETKTRWRKPVKDGNILAYHIIQSLSLIHIYATGYLCDEHNYYITPAYSDEGWYVEKTTFSDNRQAAGEQIDKTSYRANYHLHADNALAESQDQVAKGNVEISKIISSSGQSNGLELENAGFTFYLVSDLSKAAQFDQTRTGAYTLQSILDAYINKSYDNAHLKLSLIHISTTAA